MAKRLTLQERTRQRTERTERRLRGQTLIIQVRSYGEREYVRSHVWYSGAAADYVATSMSALPLAILAVCQMRKVTTVRVERRGSTYVLLAGETD